MTGYVSKQKLTDEYPKKSDLQKGQSYERDLMGADLSNSDIRQGNLSLANFNWANLAGANLFRADLRGRAFQS